MKKLCLMIAVLFMAATSFAQDYKSSIGVRLGSGYYDAASVAFKTFITAPGALEFDLGIRPYSAGDYKWTNLSLSGTYQHHFQIANVDGLKWFVGGGVVLANTFSDFDDRKGFNMGIYPTGGVDYKLKNAPIAFSADIRPTFNVVEGYDYYNSFYANGGITARYTF